MEANEKTLTSYDGLEEIWLLFVLWLALRAGKE
jgi:hypothetical protein